VKPKCSFGDVSCAPRAAEATDSTRARARERMGNCFMDVRVMRRLEPSMKT
jgi:hypothetical protein